MLGWRCRAFSAKTEQLRGTLWFTAFVFRKCSRLCVFQMNVSYVLGRHKFHQISVCPVLQTWTLHTLTKLNTHPLLWIVTMSNPNQNKINCRLRWRYSASTQQPWKMIKLLKISTEQHIDVVFPQTQWLYCGVNVWLMCNECVGLMSHLTAEQICSRDSAASYWRFVETNTVKIWEEEEETLH